MDHATSCRQLLYTPMPSYAGVRLREFYCPLHLSFAETPAYCSSTSRAYEFPEAEFIYLRETFGDRCAL
jgi:hypothetical protein